jgi:hypothetical protein
MRVIVDRAAIQDRDGAGLALDKIRKLRWQGCRGCAWRLSSGATT